MEPLTLYQFLEQTGARVRAYDVGRRIRPIGREPFLAFEQANAPYPQPMQRKAWFALVQLPPAQRDDPIIWFLRLDLDEQGLLVLAERDYLLNRLLESAQARTQGADPQAFLQDNPYAFKPREDRMALFHALLSADLGLVPSRFYQHALDYFGGTPGWDQWSFVGYQGIADVACRHDDEPLSSAIPHLPREPLVALCHCLESRLPGAALKAALIRRLYRALEQPAPDIALLAALVRAVSLGGAGDDEVMRSIQVMLVGEVAVEPKSGRRGREMGRLPLCIRPGVSNSPSTNGCSSPGGSRNPGTIRAMAAPIISIRPPTPPFKPTRRLPRAGAMIGF